MLKILSKILEINFADKRFTIIQIIIATIETTNAIIDASFLSFAFSFLNTIIDKIIAIIEEKSENGIPNSGTKEQTKAKILQINDIIYISLSPYNL